MMDDGDTNTNNSYGYNFPNSYCGCDSVGVMNSSVDFSGKIVLISRGSCQFGLKAYLAQLRGAVGVIIYNAFSGFRPIWWPHQYVWWRQWYGCHHSRGIS